MGLGTSARAKSNRVGVPFRPRGNNHTWCWTSSRVKYHRSNSAKYRLYFFREQHPQRWATNTPANPVPLNFTGYAPWVVLCRAVSPTLQSFHLTWSSADFRLTQQSTRTLVMVSK